MHFELHACVHVITCACTHVCMTCVQLVSKLQALYHRISYLTLTTASCMSWLATDCWGSGRCDESAW